MEKQSRYITDLEEQNRDLEKSLDRFLTSNDEVMAKLEERSRRSPTRMEDLYVKHALKEQVYEVRPVAELSRNISYQLPRGPQTEQPPVGLAESYYQRPGGRSIDETSKLLKPTNANTSPSQIKRVSFQSDRGSFCTDARTPLKLEYFQKEVRETTSPLRVAAHPAAAKVKFNMDSGADLNDRLSRELDPL